MDKYIKGADLIELHQIADHEFVNQYVIKNALQPYSLSYKTIPPPNIERVIFEIKKTKAEISKLETVQFCLELV
jgi:hypothetical protein